jgi:hypothetical protein
VFLWSQLLSTCFWLLQHPAYLWGDATCCLLKAGLLQDLLNDWRHSPTLTMLLQTRHGVMDRSEGLCHVA